MGLIKSAASVAFGLILTAAPAMAGLAGPQRIETASDIRQVQYRGDDAAAAIIGGAIAGIVGGAIAGAAGGNCYYNDCGDDDDEGFYGGGYYGGPGYYGGGFYPGRRYGGRGFHGGGFHGGPGGFHGGPHGGGMAHGGGGMAHAGGGHGGGRR
jgi:hypothetical protein